MITKNTRRHMLALALCAAAAGAAAPSWAQAWPTKPITLVVAYPAGGDTDALARLFAEKLSARVGQPVLVDNRPGASGVIGSSIVAKAPADGYTLLVAPSTFSIAQIVLKTGAGAGYDVLNEPGFGPGLAGTNEALSSLYAHAVEAIRAGEAAADESRPHLVFFEPAVLWSGLGDGAGPVRTTDDANLVFAPHLYAESITSGDGTRKAGIRK